MVRMPLKDIYEMAQNKKYLKIRLKRYAKRLPYFIFKAKKSLRFSKNVRHYNLNLSNLMNKSVTSFFSSHFSHPSYFRMSNLDQNTMNPLTVSFIYSKFRNPNITALKHDKNIRSSQFSIKKFWLKMRKKKKYFRKIRKLMKRIKRSKKIRTNFLHAYNQFSKSNKMFFNFGKLRQIKMKKLFRVLFDGLYIFLQKCLIKSICM